MLEADVVEEVDELWSNEVVEVDELDEEVELAGAGAATVVV